MKKKTGDSARVLFLSGTSHQSLLLGQLLAHGQLPDLGTYVSSPRGRKKSALFHGQQKKEQQAVHGSTLFLLTLGRALVARRTVGAHTPGYPARECMKDPTMSQCPIQLGV